MHIAVRILILAPGREHNGTDRVNAETRTAPFGSSMDLDPLKPITKPQLEGAAVTHLL